MGEELREYQLSGLLLGQKGIGELARNTQFNNPTNLFVPLSRLTVLYGRNGSGKTNFLNIVKKAMELECGPTEGLVYALSNELKSEIKTRIKLLKLDDRPFNDLREEWAYMVGRFGYKAPESQVSEDASNSRYTWKALVPLLEEWLVEGLVVFTSKIGVNDYGEILQSKKLVVVPILRNNSDYPLSQQAFELIENKIKAFGGEYALDAIDADLPESVRPLLNFRNFPHLSFFGFVPNLVPSRLESQREWMFLEPLNFNLLNEQKLIDQILAAQASGQKLDIDQAAWALKQGEISPSREIQFNFEPAGVSSSDQYDDEIKLILRNAWLESEFEPAAKSSAVESPRLDQKGSGSIQDALALSILRGIFPSWFDLRVDWGSVPEIVLGSHPKWVINQNVSQEKLSAAEIRWLCIVTKSIFSPKNNLLIDEPEIGLHRQAEWSLAEMLQKSELAPNVILTSHSPALLDIPGTTALHVGEGNVRGLSFTSVDPTELGINKSDLLGLHKAFLVVEGSHDKLIISTLFADQLERKRIKIVMARGAKSMPQLFDSQLLMEYTDVPLAILVDNFSSDKLQKAWDGAKATWLQRLSVPALNSFLESNLGIGSGEQVYMKNVMLDALKSGQQDRLSFFGIPEKDITMCIPAEKFGLTDDWRELHNQYLKSKIARENFKEWIFRVKALRIDEKSIKKALVALDSVPQSLIKIINDL